jgi:putative aldouronate transport system permease protein
MAPFINQQVLTGLVNSFIIVTVGTLANVVLTVLGAYVLSRRDFAPRRFFTGMVVFAVFFSGGIVPVYAVVRALNLTNSLAALIIPGAVNGVNLLILREAASEIPESVIDAAKIDGAGHLGLMFRVIIPLVKPTLAVITLYYAAAHWNDWFEASIYLPAARSKFPVQMYLRELFLRGETVVYYAVALSLPSALAVPFFARYIDVTAYEAARFKN